MRSVRERLLVVLIGGAMVFGGVALLVWALRDNLDGFDLPRDLGAVAVGDQVSIGGCVRPGSLRAISDPVGSAFVLTDGIAEIAVTRAGPMPDLFAEGELAEVSGPITGLEPLAMNGVKILAKHDQNYVPANAEAAFEAAAQTQAKPECGVEYGVDYSG